MYSKERAFYILSHLRTPCKIVVYYQATALRHSGLNRLFFRFYVVFKFYGSMYVNEAHIYTSRYLIPAKTIWYRPSFII